MKFLSCKIIHPDGDSNLHIKILFYKREFKHQIIKPNNSLRFLPAKKIFHSFENQHFNFINVGFFLIVGELKSLN